MSMATSPQPPRNMAEELRSQISNREAMIKRLGGEVMEMRRAEEEQKLRNGKLAQTIESYTTRSVLTQDELEMADREKLVTAHSALLQQHAQAARENETLLSRIQSLQNQLIERNELELKIGSLQKAHKAQTAYKDALTAKLQTAGHLKQAVHRQEKAVTQLETLVAEKANYKHAEEGSIQSPAFALLQAENEQLVARTAQAEQMAVQMEKLAREGGGGDNLEAKLAELVTEIGKLKRENAELKCKKATGGGSVGGGRNDADALEAEAKALTNEMMTNAKANAATQTKLETEAMEAKSTANLGFSSSAAFVLNEAGGTRAVPAQLDQMSRSRGYGRPPGTPPSRLDPL